MDCREVTAVKAFAAMTAALLLGGCVTEPPTLYTWGQYQDTIYEAYADPSHWPPERLADQLEQDLQQARAQNRELPPGWHAYLGSLYSQLGKYDLAVQELEREKADFPESAVLVDRLLANLARP
jgi:hypothetical protein